MVNRNISISLIVAFNYRGKLETVYISAFHTRTHVSTYNIHMYGDNVSRHRINVLCSFIICI